MDLKLLIIVLALIASIFISAILSHVTYNTDFPAFYSAASTILDPVATYQEVYRFDLDERYPIPEKKEVKTLYIYSLPVAFILAPLAWMPYYTAKTIMIFLNITSYLSAVAIILKLGNVSNRWITYGIGISCLWLPFIATLIHAQVNAVILLLVTVAVFAVKRGYPYICGALLAFAALFKIFPLAIALVLGIRNYRILIGFAVVFGASFLLPGAPEWISIIWNLGMKEIWKLGMTESSLYVWLKTINPVLAFLCPIVIGITTALITFIAKDEDFLLLTAFAIPAVFLAMPLLGYYHLTLLIFTYIYLFSIKEFKGKPLIGIIILSAIILGFPRPGPVSPFVFDPVTPIMYIMLFSLWVILGIRVSIGRFSLYA